jgi:hypothetical protein
MTNPSSETATRPGRPHGPAPRWTREQIRSARLAPLVPLLRRRGLPLIERDVGNYKLSAPPGLLLKDSYWAGPSETWPATP